MYNTLQSLLVGCQFDRRIRLQFQGARATSDAGLRAVRQLDEALGLTKSVGLTLADRHQGRDVQHDQVALLRQQPSMFLPETLPPTTRAARSAIPISALEIPVFYWPLFKDSCECSGIAEIIPPVKASRHS